jgi:hypothetical protein
MPHARHTDPSTSHSAAESVENLTMTQEYILVSLVRPGTDVDLIQRYNNSKHAPRASESGIRSRRAELVKLGLVQDTGLRTRLASGRQAIVWQVA